MKILPRCIFFLQKKSRVETRDVNQNQLLMKQYFKNFLS
jgi:hypothetical protein